MLAVFAAACSRAPEPPPPDTTAHANTQTGVASFYGREFAGKKTASGEPFKLNAMTAASRTLPLGSRAQVVNLDTGQSAKVTINDRGPYAKGRVIDLTPRAAQHIGLDRDEGLARVHVIPIAAAEPLPGVPERRPEH